MKQIYIALIMIGNTSFVIFDFNKESNMSNWRIINDAVMGGKSESTFYLNEDGNGVFEGTVSTENNGGFSLLRHRFEKLNITAYNKVVLHIKGDGKKYQFRIKSNKYDQHSYVSYFQTTNEWQLIEISLLELTPTYRGQKLNMDNYNGEQVEEIGFLIGNNKKEKFKLIFDKITIE